MDVYEMLRAEKRAKKEGEPLKEQYGRIEIDLGIARDDEQMHLSGDLITVGDFNGTSPTTFFKLNNRHSRKLYPGEIEIIKGEFGGIYLTNAAEAGKKLVLYIARAIYIYPSSAGKVKLLKTDGTGINPATDEISVDIKTAVESLDTNAFDAATDTVKQGFGGNVFNMPVTVAMVTDDAKHAFAATTKKLRDVLIKNTHATDSLMIGENQADVATIRSENFELAAGEAIGFVMVDISTLYYCTKVNAEEPTARLIGVEE